MRGAHSGRLEENLWTVFKKCLINGHFVAIELSSLRSSSSFFFRTMEICQEYFFSIPLYKDQLGVLIFVDYHKAMVPLYSHLLIDWCKPAGTPASRLGAVRPLWSRLDV